MKILLLCWRDSEHPQGGGSERYLENIALHLTKAGHDVLLMTSHYQGAAHKGHLPQGITVLRYGQRYSVYLCAAALMIMMRLRRGPLKEFNPDIIIDTQNGIPFFAKIITNKPTIVLHHHCHRLQWPVAGKILGRIGWFIESQLSPRAHRNTQFVTVSLPSAEDLTNLGINKNHIAIVRAGADPYQPETTQRSPFPHLVVLSRLVPHKQIEDALYALATLNPHYPTLQLTIIGDGWWEPKLRKLATTLNIAHAVHFVGYVSEQEKRRLLQQAWLHLMPSRTEGWGLAVIECGQQSIPTLGYQSSRGLTDSIIDGVTGKLVADRDEFTATIERLITNPRELADLGDKAAERANQFSWHGSGTAFEKVIATVLNTNDYAHGLIT